MTITNYTVDDHPAPPPVPVSAPRRRVSLEVDGQPVEVRDGDTLLDACRAAGVSTPTLCYLESLTPVNVCRVCVVELEGARTLVPSCSRRAEDGMVVKTDTDRVRHSRRLVLELLASSADLSAAPEYSGYASRYGATPERFGSPGPGAPQATHPPGPAAARPGAPDLADTELAGHHPSGPNPAAPERAGHHPSGPNPAGHHPSGPNPAAPERAGHHPSGPNPAGHHPSPDGRPATLAQPVKVDNDCYVRDYSRCILCYKCVEACGEDAQHTFAIAVAGRGFDARIATELDGALPDSACVYCGNCVGVCPTGALMFRSEYELRQAGEWDEARQEQVDTICPYCGVGCDLTLHVQDNRIVKVSSPLDHSVTHGSLCVKGRFGFEFVQEPRPARPSP